MGQVAALMVVMAVLMSASLSAATVRGGDVPSPFSLYRPEYIYDEAGEETAYEAQSTDRRDFTRILAEQAMGQGPHCVVKQVPKYYRYIAYGTATVLPAHDDGTSIGKVNSGDYNASGTSDGSGSHHAWDGVEAAEQAMGEGPHCVVEQNALTLTDNNSLMLARRAGTIADSGQDYSVSGARGESYGRISQFGNHYTFTARRLDPTTGLMHYRYRYYESVSGRFVGRDPAEYADTFNLTQSFRNSSARFIDPLGRESTDNPYEKGEFGISLEVGECGGYKVSFKWEVKFNPENAKRSRRNQWQFKVLYSLYEDSEFRPCPGVNGMVDRFSGYVLAEEFPGSDDPDEDVPGATLSFAGSDSYSSRGRRQSWGVASIYASIRAVGRGPDHTYIFFFSDQLSVSWTLSWNCCGWRAFFPGLRATKVDSEEVYVEEGQQYGGTPYND